jgi:hypothetical protein
MMCQRIGRPPTSIIGFGLDALSSLMRVPNPPARITAFMQKPPRVFGEGYGSSGTCTL